jgi:hypothetical protein
MHLVQLVLVLQMRHGVRLGVRLVWWQVVL